MNIMQASKVAALAGIAAAGLLVTAPVAAQVTEPFKRPDCSAYNGQLKAESRCFRDTELSWKRANYAALQKTGLEFVYMARPDLDSSPAAKKARTQGIEGSFAIKFSVGTDGKVSDAKLTYVTSGGIEPVAKLWVDTIRQWTFTKTDKPVVDLEYKRIYLNSKEDDEEEARKKHDSDNE